MLKRFRQILVAFAATTAVATTTVAVASPASADPGVNCSAPSISGAVMPGIWSTSNRVYASATGSVSANCVNPFFDYKYELSYHPASIFASAALSSADDVQSTSITKTGTTTNPSTSISFPDASWTRNGSGYHGVYLEISSYSKSSYQQSWPTEPTNVDWYFLPSYGNYDTAPMAQDSPPNYCQMALGYTKTGC